MEAADSNGRQIGSKKKRFVESPTGKYSGSRIPKGDCSDIAVDATVRAAAIRNAGENKPSGTLKIDMDDLREKVRTRRMEQAFYFMVDSSGSLIIRNRIAKVKAAIISMLKIHYVKRDRVGLMTFNEEKMEEIMSPTRAVNELSTAVENIKIGCGTPLSEALMSCWKFVQNYTRKHPEGFVHIILFTDGKATKSIEQDADPCEEALSIASHLKSENIDWVIVDTGLGTTKNDMPGKLAKALDARYFLLDDLDSERTVEEVWTNALPKDLRTGTIFWELEKKRNLR